MKPKDFKEGEVYSMAVTDRSYVKNPYYIIIKKVRRNFIETDIPGHHSLVIKHPSDEWDYHIPRMKYIGNDNLSRELVYNQKIV